MQKLNVTFPKDVTEKSQEINYVGSPLEIFKLKYHAAVWKPDDNSDICRKPITQASFSGMRMMNPKGGNATICRDIDPRWVDYHFQNIFVQLVMLEPEVWIPVPIGSSHPAKEKPPEKLLVRKVRIPYQRFDRDHCLPLGLASCLDYCGEKAAGIKLKNEALQFENLTRDLAIKRLKKAMLQFVPCIGDCTIFNIRNAKKRSIKNLSIEDLIQKRRGS
jgi:hypothetical protein